MIKVKIIKDWNSPNLLRQTPGSLGVWNNVKFILDDIDIDNPDFIIVLNKIDCEISISVSPENIWAVFQEPYISGIHDWMIYNHSQFNKIFTHYFFCKQEKYIKSQPLLPWHINRSYDELVNMKVPQKNQIISCISSNKADFPGHKLRLNFVNELINSDFEIKFFGRGYNYINDKWDGLSSFKYSIVIENSSSENYWTEKISDCYLSYTMPIYYGCKNLGDYFPVNSYIYIDINNCSESFEIIRNALDSNLWEKNFDSIV